MEHIRDQWTGDLVGRLHVNRVTRQDLANELGVSKQYITMILNGQRSPIGAKYIMEGALNSILDKRARVEDMHEC